MTALELFTDDAEQAAQRERERQAEAEAVDADLRNRDADYTPMAIARECVRAAMPRALAHAALHRSPGAPATIRVLDVGAGGGAWSRAAVDVYRAISGGSRSDVHVTAVELDGRERPHLERVADRVIIGDWTRALERAGAFAGPREYDVVIGNPPFSLLRAQGGSVEKSMPAQLLQVAPAVALFSRLATWSKDRPGVSVRRKYPPAFVWEVPGSVKFRAPGAGAFDPKTGKFKLYGADQHSYAVFLWLRGHTGPTTCELLRDFTAEERRWTVRPGTEP
jgi:hypothetical protein